MRYVVDTSVLAGSGISKELKAGKFGEDVEIIIPQVVLAEIEYQANMAKTTGFHGLEELRRLRQLEREGKIRVLIVGERPTLQQVRLAPGGELDNLVRREAEKYSATLLTSDHVQAAMCEAEGINVILLKEEGKESRRIQDYFLEDSLSVHLKEDVPPMTKRGTPGSWKLERLSDKPVTRRELEELASQIIKEARSAPRCFIEIDEEGATVVQLREYRIAITRPPFSERMEITAVRPLLKVTLDDYAPSEKLRRRLIEEAEGVLIAGRPGAGKSTFASALAEFYQKQGKIVKTLEKPRDLQVNPEITQYTALRGDMERTADVLLLVRPDYCIYDELRKTKDFQVFADLRFAGVGLVGVVHASRPIDAIQRFIGRVELGLICRIIDTVIFIEDGRVGQVLSLNMTVKVPTGMTEADLARPVIEVRDFETGELQYEIYTFGEQTVVVPISPRFARGVKRRKREVRGAEVPVEVEERKKHVVLTLPEKFAGASIDVYADERYLFTLKADGAGKIKLRKNTTYGEAILNEIEKGKRITCRSA
ncbi:MAG: Flp pilus assembly complex ATPase component TadA [Candidatus Freyarchaeota archaeon]|nr:Flp pilus assembly complex ATPase component TadA [Candidatus Jordarchaeia archaeon]